MSKLNRYKSLQSKGRVEVNSCAENKMNHILTDIVLPPQRRRAHNGQPQQTEQPQPRAIENGAITDRRLPVSVF